MPLPVILITHEFAPFRGGAATYVGEIAAAARRLGIAVEVWTPGGGGDVRVGRSARLGPAGIGGLARGLRRRRQQLQDSAAVLLSVGAHMAWALSGLPARNVTVFFHGSEVFKFQQSRLWQRPIRRLYADARGYAVASEYVKKLVGESGLVSREKGTLLAPCAVPTALQAASSVNPARPDDVPVRLLTVARLHPRKGQVEMVQALGRLPAEDRDRITYEMVGVGEAAYQREIEAAAQAAGIRCQFTGEADDDALKDAYRRADIYAQSSQTLPRSVEGFGISYLEAAAFGIPSVGVDTGGVGEAVVDGETGLLAAEGDVDGLATRVRRLIGDPALRRRLGEGGRRYAERFSWERSARALCDFATRQA